MITIELWGGPLDGDILDVDKLIVPPGFYEFEKKPQKRKASGDSIVLPTPAESIEHLKHLKNIKVCVVLYQYQITGLHRSPRGNLIANYVTTKVVEKGTEK